LNEQLTLQCEDLKKQLAGERQAAEGLKKEIQMLKEAAHEKEAAAALIQDQIHQNKTEIVVKHREMSRLLEVGAFLFNCEELIGAMTDFFPSRKILS